MTGNWMTGRMKPTRHAVSAALLVAAAVMLPASPARPADFELVHNPPMSYSVNPLSPGSGSALEPRWLNAMGMVGAGQYRLVMLSNAAYLDLVVTQSEGAKCSIRRYRAVNADGVPVAPAQATLTLPLHEPSLMMRLAQSADTQYVFLYNEADSGACTVWLQAS